jgi:hypothetical protein
MHSRRSDQDLVQPNLLAVNRLLVDVVLGITGGQIRIVLVP